MKKNSFFKFSVSLFLLTTGFFLLAEENIDLTLEQIKVLQEITPGEQTADETEKNFTEFLTFKEDLARKQECERKLLEDSRECIFGYTIFTSVPSTYALSSDVPVPPSYVLGPGDQLRIEYFGNENLSKEGYITRTGSLHLPILGPITLAGLSFSEAEELISTKVEKELIGTKTFITLGELRSINIYVLGNAFKPGRYTISALTTLTNAIFSTGGVNTIGSLRNIEVKRNGQTIQTFDLYDLLIKGDTSKDVRLQQGDTVFVPLLKNYASLKGTILRPGLYEFKEGETLKDLISFGGDVNNNSRIELSRINSSTGKRDLQIISSQDLDSLNTELKHNDSLNIVEIESLKAKNILLSGQFNYPGYYSITEGDTILDLIERAGGLKESAYTAGAIFKRKQIAEQQKKSYLLTADELEKSLIDAVSSGVDIDGDAYLSLTAFIEKLRNIKPEGRQVIEMDLLKMKRDPKKNLQLQNGDELIIPSRSASVNVVGEVLNSASHIHEDNLSVDDYIKLSGGMTRGADKNKIFIIFPNGQSLLANERLFGQGIRSVNATLKILPGSTIVVSRDPDPFDAFKLVSVITPILSDLAISAASIAAIND